MKKIAMRERERERERTRVEYIEISKRKNVTNATK